MEINKTIIQTFKDDTDGDTCVIYSDYTYKWENNFRKDDYSRWRIKGGEVFVDHHNSGWVKIGPCYFVENIKKASYRLTYEIPFDKQVQELLGD